MNAVTEEIRERLFLLQDKEYADFNSRIIPDIERSRIIGVRSPELKKLAKDFAKADMSAFLADLPHKYIEESYIHAQIINRVKDFDECLRLTELFLPYIDNWETCDSLAPKALGKNKPALTEKIKTWHSSGHTYTVRFGTGCLMRYFLDDDFDVRYAELAAAVRFDEYYINMMTAWYFATALAKHYDAVVPFIEQRRLDNWTHNKAIQKATESFRITPEQKTYLRTLKVK